jgi:hypothetical protein
VSLAEDILARARLEGVALFPKGEGKLGYQAHGHPLSPDLKALIVAHKEAVLAVLAPSSVKAAADSPKTIRRRVLAQWDALRKARFGDQPDPCLKAEEDIKAAGVAALSRAKRLLERLAANRVSAALDAHGGLSLVDRSGRRRDLTRFANMGKTFEALVAALEIDPELIATRSTERNDAKREATRRERRKA